MVYFIDKLLPFLDIYIYGHSKASSYHYHFTSIFTDEEGKDVEAIRAEKGELRQIVMDVLYQAGGLKGLQIGRIFGLDYGSVS